VSVAEAKVLAVEARSVTKKKVDLAILPKCRPSNVDGGGPYRSRRNPCPDVR
jgi:hypothetical protein